MKESLAEISSQRAEAVPEHVLLPVWTPLHRRPGAHSVCHRAAEPAGRRRAGGRAALGRAGAQHALPELPQVGLVSRLHLASGRQVYTASIEALFAAYDRVGAGMLEALKSAIPQPAEMKDESVPAHAEGTRLRRGALSAAAGDQHIAGADRERAYAGEPDLAAAGERVCRGAQSGRKAQSCRGRACMERHPRRGACSAGEAASFTIPDAQGREASMRDSRMRCCAR